jgi:hypothetical protein
MIQTVPELWKEWTVGIGGKPSVEILERQYGASWRPSHKERVLFGRRKVIINEIYRYIQARGVTPEAAVAELELVRSMGQMSLYKLWHVLSHRCPG